MVLFGVEECSMGASRSDHLSSDLNNVVSVLSEADHTIQPLSIKDCFRLGKFTFPPSSQTHSGQTS